MRDVLKIYSSFLTLEYLIKLKLKAAIIKNLIKHQLLSNFNLINIFTMLNSALYEY